MAFREDIDPINPKWYAVVTSPRHEKYVVNQLEKKGINAWTPLLKKTRVYKTKFRTVYLPLITRYVFVNITQKEYISVLEEQLVISFLHNRGRIFPIKEEEIDILRRVSGEDVEVQTTIGEIEKGDKVEIIYGDLTGLKGEVVRFKGKNYVGIVLETLGMNMLIDVPKVAIHKLEGI